MIYTTAIDTFYLTDDQLKNSSPSRKDGIDETIETNLRIYGCDLIQKSGILLRLPQVVMATGQVLFHRFYCKKSFASFNVKMVAASCVWLASKLEENPRKAKHVLIVFHRMECRRQRENLLPINDQQHLISKKYYSKLEDLNRTERHLLKEMGFICHVEHPHKFISNYLATLVETPHPELRQEAWNLANDSLRTTLCVRFKSEVVACGVVYAAARRFRVPLPDENHHPWWKAFDIDEVCKVLAHLYSLPKAQYIPVCKAGEDTFASSNKSQAQQVPKEGSLNEQEANNYDTSMAKVTSLPTSLDSAGGTKEALKAAALDKLKESKKCDDDAKKTTTTEGESRVLEPVTKSKVEQRTEVSGEMMNMEKERLMIRENDGGRDSDRERERDKLKERSHRSKEKGRHSDKSRHHPSRDRGDYHTSSYSTRDKDRHRHHPYCRNFQLIVVQLKYLLMYAYIYNLIKGVQSMFILTAVVSEIQILETALL